MNVLDFAMQMELDTKAHYESLEKETPVAGLKKIFSILAADEQKHYDVMDDMRTGVTPDMADSTALEDAKYIFQTLKIEESLLDELRTRLDAYRYAMKIEADSIELYEDIARREHTCGNTAVVRLLMKIIEEEKKHYNIVENIHGLIAEYENFLVWNEFSAIRE